MRVIGIDQSYTGFAYSIEAVSLKKAFPATKYRGPEDRLWHIRKWFRGWLNEQIGGDSRSVDLIVMEGYANGAKNGREIAGELGGVVKLAIMDEWSGQPPLIVPPTSLKKFVTGKGVAKKNEMLLGVYKRWGVEFADDNQADAFSLEKFGQAYLEMTTHAETQEYPAFQREVVEKVRHLV